ncbi:MAG: hypothetical protein MRZ36_05210 [Eubacterium sp.]|nr:hypothetical protein [Eubacterium sp.]
MKEKPTTELLNILENLDKHDMDHYIRQFGSTEQNLSIFSEYIAAHDIPVSSIVKNCNGLISRSYVYDILNGTKKNPSRDILLILCLASKMNMKSTRRILENYHHRELYAKDTRDIIIATYINHEDFDISHINDELHRYGLPLLGADSGTII